MALLNTQTVVEAGTPVAFAAASAGGDTATTGRGVILLVRNADAAAHNVTLVTPGNVDNLAIADRIVNVGAGVTEAIPLEALYRDPASGVATINYDAVVNVTVAVIALED